MKFENIRPIISGLLGALTAIWLARLWARWIPATVGRKSRIELESAHGWKVRLANILCAAAIIGGVLVYQVGLFDRYDWRGLGLAFGLMAFLPLALFFFSSLRGGAQNIRECFVFYAISQQSPPAVLLCLLVAFTIIGFVALAALF